MAGEACNQREKVVVVPWQAPWLDASRLVCAHGRGTHTGTHIGGYETVASDKEPPVCYVVCWRTSKVWEKSGRGDEAVGQ